MADDDTPATVHCPKDNAELQPHCPGSDACLWLRCPTCHSYGDWDRWLPPITPATRPEKQP